MPELSWSGEALSELWRLGVALAVGLLIGGEREQRKTEGPDRAAAGIRTFAVAALLGGVAALLGPVALAVLGAAVAALALSGYLKGSGDDPGLTTELSLLLTYGLGALASSRPALAFAGGICTAVILAARSQMHAFFRDTLSPRELRDALVLGVAALVVLPVLPDRPVGPFDALNLHTLWRLATVMMVLTAGGYVAQRALGGSAGLAIAGLVGGFVSSSATIGAMGVRAKENPAARAGAVAGACASTVATFVMLAVVVGLADAVLLRALVWPLGLGGAAAGAYALAFALRAVRSREAVAPRGRAFSIGSALLFSALVGGVGLAAALARSRFGEAAVPVTAAVGGLADAHASSASAASLCASGLVSAELALWAVMLAFTTNTLTKVAVAFGSGTRAFGLQVTAGLALVAAATWGGFFLALRLGAG